MGFHTIRPDKPRSLSYDLEILPMKVRLPQACQIFSYAMATLSAANAPENETEASAIIPIVVLRTTPIRLSMADLPNVLRPSRQPAVRDRSPVYHDRFTFL